QDVTLLVTGGTVYPGLIELHNHLSYNCLRLWQVPRQFTNRDQWSSCQMQAVYRQLISGPMKVIGSTPRLVPALVRYVEAKCLVAGVTTSQGIALYSAPGIRTFYQGVVRNTDLPDDPALPAAPGHIPDVARMKERGVPIGLGSDWSPSGSKNLLGELKAAYAVGRHAPDGQIFSAQDLVRMVTCDAARILDWQDSVGSLEAGKRADLIAI